MPSFFKLIFKARVRVKVILGLANLGLGHWLGLVFRVVLTNEI